MPKGPESMKPVGTARRERINSYVRAIDEVISEQEGYTVRFYICRHYGVWSEREKIIRIYREAGWKYVYFHEKPHRHLVLTMSDEVYLKDHTPIYELSVWDFIKWVFTLQFIRGK